MEVAEHILRWERGAKSGGKESQRWGEREKKENSIENRRVGWKERGAERR